MDYSLRANVRGTLIYLTVFVAVCAATPWLATVQVVDGRVQWREAATILLFLPLIWSFLRLRPLGMILAGTILAVLRVAIEWLQHRSVGRPIGWPEAVLESAFPLALYVALGLAFHVYRRRQEGLMDRLVEAKASQTRQEMASRLAHDFNNVLTVISGTAQLMQTTVRPETQEARDVASITQAAEQGMVLVREMMSISRDVPAQKVPCDLVQTVGQQVQLIRRILPPGIRLEEQPSPQPLIVQADPGQLLRVLTNLCMNARQAMPEGGRLTVRTGRRGNGREWALLEVQDTGRGIDPQHLQRIFQPFFTTRHTSGGTGLGLSIVKSIVEDHGGTISVSSQPGQGACFTILLPLRQTAE